MLRILDMLMQDAMDFSWENARNFYEQLGLDVENGDIRWGDSEAVNLMRMTYSRTVFPEKKEEKQASKNQQKSAPAGMKCCAAYQTRSCENSRDHTPFTHACSYCFKNSSILARHAEQDCFKKNAAESKNGKKREPPSSLA